jgi:hypothetical protein
MLNSPREIARGSECRVSPAWNVESNGTWWSQHREASLNWLALGLLLAAWNVSDNDTATGLRRPEALRGYSQVSVRAAHRVSAINCWHSGTAVHWAGA